MDNMNTRCAGQSPADRLQERRRRAPRRTVGMDPEAVRMARAVVDRIESGEFDDAALARAVYAASSAS